MQRKNELREALTDADAVIVDHEDVDEVLEYVDDDTDVLLRREVAASDLTFLRTVNSYASRGNRFELL